MVDKIDEQRLINKTRSKFNKLLPVQDLCKRNQNFPRGKKLLPLSCLQHQFPRVKIEDVRRINIIDKEKNKNSTY